MEEPEHLLKGGNVSGPVVRIGGTVRKLPTKGTASCAALLDHLHAIGFTGAPRNLGYDDQGRWVLEYAPGMVCSDGTRFSLADLQRVGQIIRDFHDASSTFIRPGSASWNVVMPCDRDELICHNDLAPWNLVQGETRWAFIDWDSSAPGTRVWDLSYAALTFPPFTPGCDLGEAVNRLIGLLDGYGLAKSQESEMLQTMVLRARAMESLLIDGARTGQQPWANLHAEGHTEYWGKTADHIQRHKAQLTELLLKR